MNEFQEFISHPIARAAIAGFLTAAAADFMAFRAWKSFNEALEYKWGLAAFRWCQGIAISVASAVGISIAT